MSYVHKWECKQCAASAAVFRRDWGLPTSAEAHGPFWLIANENGYWLVLASMRTEPRPGIKWIHIPVQKEVLEDLVGQINMAVELDPAFAEASGAVKEEPTTIRELAKAYRDGGDWNGLAARSGLGFLCVPDREGGWIA